MSGIMAISLSPHAMWIFSTGMPNVSTVPAGSISTKFS